MHPYDAESNYLNGNMSRISKMNQHEISFEINLIDRSTTSEQDSYSLQNNEELCENNLLQPLKARHGQSFTPILTPRKICRKSNSMKEKECKEESQLNQKPFVCEKCSSPYVVNPARSHSSAKNYAPRRAIDPVTNQVLRVCNACRLSIVRARKAKSVKQQAQPSEEDKVQFMEDCAKFSASLVEKLKDSDANRLHCPVFITRPCKCIQKYLAETDDCKQTNKALNLLNLLKKAKILSSQKNSVSQMQSPRPRGLLRRKSQVFEEFVKETREYLRNELKLCERACQRILMYSNNFLHKQLKSTPDQSARIQQLGVTRRPQLCPISKIAGENCCQDRCVLMALTHSQLLEDWRATARRSQRDARRVLAEMLTPSGGTKANCYKFIRMITGCSHTTICLVNEQLWHTQGRREPPEHGLKRWWRQRTGHNKKGSGNSGKDDFTVNSISICTVENEKKPCNGRSEGTFAEDDNNIAFTDVDIPSANELQKLAPEEAGRRLLQQRHKLANIQRQLAHQQHQLEELRQQRPLVLGCCSGSTELQQCLTPLQTTVVRQPLQTVAHQQAQVVQVLEIPSTLATVIPSLAEVCQQQQQQQQPPPTTLSVVSNSGEVESVPSANVPSTQAVGTVIFVPEFETLTSVSAEHSRSGNITYNTNMAGSDSIQIQQNKSPRAHPQDQIQTVQFSTVSSQPQSLHIPPVQFHVPVDVPVQLAVQSTEQITHSAVQSTSQFVETSTRSNQSTDGSYQIPSWTRTQPIILSSPQHISYQVTQSRPTQYQVSLPGTSAAIVNVVNKDNQYVQTIDPQIYYLETINCVNSTTD